MTRGLTGRWAYLAQTVSDIRDLRTTAFEDAIRHHLLLTITGRAGITDMERDLLALPTKLGGMGISNPTKTCNEKFMSSERISAPWLPSSSNKRKSIPVVWQVDKPASRAI